MSTPFTTGIKVHKLKQLRLHGKMLLRDGVAAIVGSINFAAGSLDGRRELAIEVRATTTSWIDCTRLPNMTGNIRTLVRCLASACGDSTATAPSTSALVTFAVAGETFRVSLTSSDQVAAARAAQSGGRARIPNGRTVPGMQVNVGWSWYLEDVMFAEVVIEVCDGRPSDVERQGTGVGLRKTDLVRRCAPQESVRARI